MKKCSRYGRLQVCIIACWISFCAAGWAAPVEVTDDTGNRIRLDAAPRQVVSLVPSATEIIFAIGAGKSLAGITHHSAAICGAGDKTIVGGFFSPSADHVMALNAVFTGVLLHSDPTRSCAN